MKRITDNDIISLRISPATAVEWVRESFLMKNRSQLPPKVSLHPQGSDFFNTMPCILPEEYHTFGCKVVSRIAGNHPALKSEMMLFDTHTGEMTALFEANWITAMRTGAVAALAINTLRKSDASTYSFIGLGAMGSASLECFLATNKGKKITVRLKRYKDHAERTIERFSNCDNVKFIIADSMEQLVTGADVIVSCITEAKDLLFPDTSLFKSGVLIVPVHTRGFQNCDTIFDKVIADDEGHVKGFRYFSQFRNFRELSDILAMKSPGRESDTERIISYNIGLGLHDVLFATKIEHLMNQQITPPHLISFRRHAA